ncbi:unnamed protein product [Microthlaspi erraticum]|uniref:Uncharacterized protein n=1 Tax=Microthlaspi erraticum TaxID=1685480 RepID=A0A6D2LIK7_9BRAS|nr:unnamed protein product [Microthlaspi erraticum]
MASTVLISSPTHRLLSSPPPSSLLFTTVPITMEKSKSDLSTQLNDLKVELALLQICHKNTSGKCKGARFNTPYPSWSGIELLCVVLRDPQFS